MKHGLAPTSTSSPTRRPWCGGSTRVQGEGHPRARRAGERRARAAPKSRKLALWVGGDREVFDRFKPVLDAIGDQPYYVGPDRRGLGGQARAQLRGLRGADRAGRGLHAWGSRPGWTPLALWKAVRQGAGGRRRTFDGLADQFLPGTFDPPAFALRLSHKDVSLAAALGRELGVPMRLANLALEELTEAHQPRLGRARLARGHAAAGGAGGREDRGARRPAQGGAGEGRPVRPARLVRAPASPAPSAVGEARRGPFSGPLRPKKSGSIFERSFEIAMVRRSAKP